MTSSEVLDKKPLVEAIFEIRWELTGANSFASTGMPTDQLYDISVGVLQERLKSKFPSYMRLPAAAIPGSMMPHQPQHQLRSSNLSWPLVQLGPGILTINETETYTSAKFIPMCLDVLATLRNFWAEHHFKPKIKYSALRYIDAIELGETSISEVLAKLDINFLYGKKISGVAGISDKLNAFQLTTRMPCTSPDGHLDMAFSKGLKSGVPALIWETTVASENEKCETFDQDPEKWLSQAHAVAHDWTCQEFCVPGSRFVVS